MKDRTGAIINLDYERKHFRRQMVSLKGFLSFSKHKSIYKKLNKL